MELSGHEATLNQNLKIEKLREKWRRVLSKIEYQELAQEQGLQLLHSIEGRLDRMDSSGIKERLKLKYQIFEKL